MVAAISCLFATSLPAAEPAGLSALTYSGEQHALTALDREIVAAGKDPARLVALATELLAVLRQSDASFAARQAAAQRLGRVLAPADTPDAEKALKPLRAMLIDERDSDLARLALEPVPGGACDRLFVQSLEPTSGRTRLGILDSIGRRPRPGGNRDARRSRRPPCHARAECGAHRGRKARRRAASPARRRARPAG